MYIILENKFYPITPLESDSMTLRFKRFSIKIEKFESDEYIFCFNMLMKETIIDKMDYFVILGIENKNIPIDFSETNGSVGFEGRFFNLSVESIEGHVGYEIVTFKCESSFNV